MSTMTVRELITKLGFKADTKGVETYEQKIDKLKGGLTKLVGLAAKATVGVAGLGAAAFGEANKVGELSNKIIGQADALGLTTDQYQEWMYVLESAGAEADDLADVVGTLADKALDAAGDSKSMAEDFKLIGVNARDFKKLKPDEIMLKVADAFAATGDESKRAAAASRLLGDDMAKKVTPVFRKGSQEIMRLRGEAHQLGVVMDKQGLESARKYALQVSKIQAVGQGLRRELALALIPTMSKAAAKTLSWVQVNRQWIRDKIEVAGRKIGEGFEWTLERMRRINKFVEDKIGGWGRLFRIVAATLAASGVIKILSVVKVVVMAISSFGVVAAAKVAAVVAVVATLALVIEDLFVYLKGGQSFLVPFFDDMLTRMENAGGLVGKLGALIRSVGRAGDAAFRIIRRIALPVLDVIRNKAGEAWDWFKIKAQALWEYLEPLIGKMLDGMTGFFNSLADKLIWLDENWEQVMGLLKKEWDDFTKDIKDTFTAVVDYIIGKFRTIGGYYDKARGLLADAGIDLLPDLGLAPRGQMKQLAAASVGANSTTFGGDNNTFNVNGANLSARELARQFGKMTGESKRQRAASTAGREM